MKVKTSLPIYYLNFNAILAVALTDIFYQNHLINRYFFEYHVSDLRNNFLWFYSIHDNLYEPWIPFVSLLSSCFLVTLYSYRYIIIKKTPLAFKILITIPFIQIFCFIYLLIANHKTSSKYKVIFQALIILMTLILWYWSLSYFTWLAVKS